MNTDRTQRIRQTRTCLEDVTRDKMSELEAENSALRSQNKRLGKELEKALHAVAEMHKKLTGKN